MILPYLFMINFILPVLSIVYNPVYRGECPYDYVINGGIVPDLTMSAIGTPYFSWDTMPVFWHAANLATGLTDLQIGYLASHNFATVTIEKFEADLMPPAGTDAENKMSSAALKIKTMNPSSQIIFYQNSMLSYPNYNFNCLVQANDLFFKENGHFYTIRPSFPYPGIAICGQSKIKRYSAIDTFDFTQLKMLQLWQDQLASVKNRTFTNGDNIVPLFSGLFIDTTTESRSHSANWKKGHIKAIDSVASIYPNGMIVADDTANVAHGKKYAEMIQFFMIDSPGKSMYESIMLLQNQAVDGRIMQVHANKCGPDDQVGNERAGFVRRMTMAGFLIGACKNSYYACNTMFRVDVPNSNQLCWYNEYNQPLGTPLGKFKESKIGDNILMYRKFSSETTAYVQLANKSSQNEGSSCICWGNPVNGEQQEFCTGGETCTQMQTAFETSYNGDIDNWEVDGCQ